MSPIRIIIIGILLYLGYRLITGAGRKEQEPENSSQQEQGDQVVEDVLVEDPVCGNLVPKQQAIELEDNGEIIYFCSKECCDKYIKKGEKE